MNKFELFFHMDLMYHVLHSKAITFLYISLVVWDIEIYKLVIIFFGMLICANVFVHCEICLTNC